MAPDRGASRASSRPALSRQATASSTAAERYLAAHADEPQNFTARGVLVGLAIGVVICFSNTYFGLQTGWVSGMAMPSALIGFAWFKATSRFLRLPFTPVENVLVQSVAGSVGTMPLGCGFVAVIPALNYLVAPAENGPVHIGLGRLIVWALGIAFFGVVFAVPLRREVIIREKLKFPSGTATALMIRVLHGEHAADGPSTRLRRTCSAADGEQQRLLAPRGNPDGARASESSESDAEEDEPGRSSEWKARIRLLVVAFAGSAVYVRARVVASLRLTVADRHCVLCPAAAQRARPRALAGSELAVDAEPVASVRGTGHHHGPGHDAAHAARRRGGLGHPLAAREAARLGTGPGGRLDQGQQGLDRVDQPRHHAGRLARQLGLAHGAPAGPFCPQVRPAAGQAPPPALARHAGL